MKRAVPLRRTPLRQGKPLARRRRVKPRSEAMERRLTIYRPLRDAYLAHHRQCEWPLGCPNASTELHHRAGREGDRLFDMRFFAASCRFHNDLAERETGLCRAVGWLLSYINPEAAP